MLIHAKPWRNQLPPPQSAVIDRDYGPTKSGLVRALIPNANPGGPGDALLRDISGFHADASFKNGATWGIDTDYPFRVITLSGSGSQHIQCAAPYNQNKAGQTWLIRFRYNGNTATQDSALIAFDNGAGGTGRVVLGVLDTAGGNGPFKLFSTLNGGVASTSSVAEISVGSEYFAVLTFDGTTASFYVNGNARGTFAPTVNSVTLPANLWIGAYTNVAASANIMLSEFLCFNKWLPASAVWDLYSPATRARRYVLPKAKIISIVSLAGKVRKRHSKRYEALIDGVRFIAPSVAAIEAKVRAWRLAHPANDRAPPRVVPAPKKAPAPLTLVTAEAPAPIIPAAPVPVLLPTLPAPTPGEVAALLGERQRLAERERAAQAQREAILAVIAAEASRRKAEEDDDMEAVEAILRLIA